MRTDACHSSLVTVRLSTFDSKVTAAMGFATDAIHVGQEPDPATGAIIVPIYQTSTFVQEGLGKHKGYEYARTANPTRAALERNLAALEGGRFAFAFASGMAAINAVMSLLKAGDHVVAGRSLYGGRLRPVQRVLPPNKPRPAAARAHTVR